MITGLQELIQLNHPIEDKDITVRVEDCIPGVVSTYQPIAEEKGISLGYTVPTGLPLVACPTYWLRQMLQHLLQNSLKFTPDQGKVYVRANFKGQQIEVSVSDTGMGIEMSDLPKLFNSFYRGRNALTHDIAGVGLGLVATAMLWISGHLGFVPEHPETLEAVYLTTNSGRMEAMSFVAPMAYILDWLMFYSDVTKVLSFGMVSAMGVVCGAAISSLLNGSFRWEGFGQTSDLAHHLVGAVLMGVGGVTAMGCTIGQGVSGISTLSLNAITAVLGIGIGAWLAIKYQIWSLERSL
jgi:hypothetical protein